MWNFYIDFAKKHSKFTKNYENNDKTSKNTKNQEKCEKYTHFENEKINAATIVIRKP